MVFLAESKPSKKKRIFCLQGMRRWLLCSRTQQRHFNTLSSVDHFAQHFKSTFPEDKKRPIRAVGREAEYPVVWKDGTAADVRLLLSTIAERSPGKFKATHESAFDRLLTSQDTRHLVGLLSLIDGGTELTLEVGWGTIEIGTPVCENLFKLRDVYESTLSLVTESADSLGMYVLGYGIHPRSAPTLELLSPKARYSVLKKVIGQDWLSFTVSASDQLHVDVSRDEITDVLNVSNMLSSVVIAMCGNSSVYVVFYQDSCRIYYNSNNKQIRRTTECVLEFQRGFDEFNAQAWYAVQTFYLSGGLHRSCL